jgi:hypothetical protein
VTEGASILGFSPSLGYKTIYKNIYSRRYESDLHADRQSEPTTHLFDLTSDRHFGEEQADCAAKIIGILQLRPLVSG